MALIQYGWLVCRWEGEREREKDKGGRQEERRKEGGRLEEKRWKEEKKKNEG